MNISNWIIAASPIVRMVRTTKHSAYLSKLRVSRKCFSMTTTRNSTGHQPNTTLQTRESASEGVVVLSPLTGVEIVQKTVTEYLWDGIGEWEERRAVTCAATGVSYAYKELRDLCQRFASSLLTPVEDGGVGMNRGDVLAILMHNSADFPVIFHGAIEAGLVVSATNPSFTVGEISRQLDTANAKILATTYECLANAKEAVKNTSSCSRIIVVDNPKTDHDFQGCISYSELISRPAQSKYIENKEPVNLRSTVVLPFSSGTEGVPKGVMLSHMNLVSSMCMVEHPDVLARNVDDPAYQDVVLGVLPLFHIYGMHGVMNVCLNMGRHIVFMPRFEPFSFMNTIRKYRPTILYLVPPLLLFLAKHPEVTREDLSSFRQIITGAASASQPVIEAFLERAGRKDIDFREGYGLTETAGVVSILPMYAEKKIGSCGLLTPFTEARIIDDSGKGLPSYENGELLLRGPQIMEGYLNNEEATKKMLDPDGWLHTGDVAYYDDSGYFYIVDRIKELIKVKGSQVSPTELEGIIRHCPGVSDVAVVGIPDEKSGELPAAFIVRSVSGKDGKGSEVTAEDINTWMEGRVADYKRLSGGIRFIDDIPKSTSGKVLRRALTSML